MKLITVICTALMAFSLTACTQKQEKKEMKNLLVAYFSASGTTKGVAQQLAEVAGADLHEIKPEQPYTDADLDWNNKQSRSSVEMQDKHSRPAITGKLQNMQEYNVVYVGFPIWWYTCPTIINTFMEAYDFQGKTVIPFATSGGSSIKKACADVKACTFRVSRYDSHMKAVAKAEHMKGVMNTKWNPRTRELTVIYDAKVTSARHIMHFMA